MIAGAPAVRIDDQNPWPGLAAFDESAGRFFNGRTEECAALRRLVTQAPLTVLFGASGLGKTSLLQAGLFPLLRAGNYLPVLVRLDVRTDGSPWIDQVEDALRAEVTKRSVDAPAWRPHESLWEYLHRQGLELWSEDNHLLTPVFVFDQFEELFTLGAAHVESAARLKEDLADLIENRVPEGVAQRLRAEEAAGLALSLDSQRYKVLLSFREDFLAVVEGLKRTIPSIMRNRFRLLPMSRAQAFEAVHKSAPHLVDEQTSQQIVSFIAGVDQDSVPDAEIGSIEPALLSLVCEGLNERRKADRKNRLDGAMLQGTGRAIVANFYRSKVADMPGHVRRFIQEELITERGFRKPCDVDDAKSVHGVSEAQLAALVDRRLLRIEHVRGTQRVELTHDLLTPVVREQRDADREAVRRAKERQVKRRQVAAAVALVAIAVAGVSSAIYFRGLQREADRLRIEAQEASARAARAAAGERAERERAEQRENDALKARQEADLNATEAMRQQEAAVAAKLAADRAAEAERIAREDAVTSANEAIRQQRAAEIARDNANQLKVQADEASTRATKAAAAADANAAVAQAQRSAAEGLRSLAVAQELAARARALQRTDDLPLAAQMVVRAFAMYQQSGCRSAEAPARVCSPDEIDASILPALQVTLDRMTRNAGAERFGAGGVLNATVGGPLLHVTAGSGDAAPLTLVTGRFGAGVFRIDLPRTWRALDETDANRPVPRRLASLERRATAMAVGPAGAPVVTGYVDGDVIVSPAVWGPQPVGAAPVAAVALSADGRALVSAGQDGTLRRVDRLGQQTAARVIDAAGPSLIVRVLAPAPGSDAVLVGTNRGLFLWNTRNPPVFLDGTQGRDVRSLAYSTDGLRLAYGERLGAVHIARWTGTALAGTTTFDARHASAVTAIAFASGGRLLASGGADGTIRVFRLDGRSGTLPAVFEHGARVESVAFADDDLLLSGGSDGVIRRWSVRMDRLRDGVCRLVARNGLFPLKPADRSILRALLPDGDATQNACGSGVGR